MKLSIAACAGLAALQTTFANPINSFARRTALAPRDNLPSEGEMLNVIAAAQDVATSINTSPEIFVISSVFLADVQGILHGNASTLDTESVPDLKTSVANVGRIINRIFDSTVNGTDEVSTLPTDPDSVIKQMEGWVDGSIPLPDQTVPSDVPAETVADWNNAILDIVKLWKKTSGDVASPRQKLAMRSAIGATLHKREPIAAILALTFAFLAWLHSEA